VRVVELLRDVSTFEGGAVECQRPCLKLTVERYRGTVGGSDAMEIP